MGGQVSEVSEATTRVLMEAATGRAEHHADLERRWGCAPRRRLASRSNCTQQAIAAQRLAARLMVDLCGAHGAGHGGRLPASGAAARRPLRHERISRLLGAEIAPDSVEEILERLGFERADGGWVVPPWRDSDVQREADLIEEVARIHGLDKLPTTLPAPLGGRAAHREPAPAPASRGPAARPRPRRVHLLLVHLSSRRRSTPPGRRGVLALQNPLSEDQSLMRPLLLPGLLDAARHNSAHGRGEVALFESTHVYRSSTPLDEAPEARPEG